MRPSVRSGVCTTILRRLWRSCRVHTATARRLYDVRAACIKRALLPKIFIFSLGYILKSFDKYCKMSKTKNRGAATYDNHLYFGPRQQNMLCYQKRILSVAKKTFYKSFYRRSTLQNKIELHTQ